MARTFDHWYQGWPVIALYPTGAFDWWLRGVPIIQMVGPGESLPSTEDPQSPYRREQQETPYWERAELIGYRILSAERGHVNPIAGDEESQQVPYWETGVLLGYRTIIKARGKVL